jgi:hypothetical protein
LSIAFANRARGTAQRPHGTARDARSQAQPARSSDQDSRGAAHDARRLTVDEIAWLLALPCAVLTVAAMVLLGGPLGNLLLANHGRVTLLPEWQFAVFLKPAEQARYLIALAAPVLLAVATVLLAQRSLRLPPRTTGALVTASQCAGAAFIVLCVWEQRTVETYFTARTLLVAGALAALVLCAIKSGPARRRATAALNSQRPAVAVIGLAVAVLATVTWVLAGVNFDDTIRNSGSIFYAIRAPLDETFAVLDGRTPLVNFIPQYGWLWPYATALIMSVFGVTFTVFSLTMCALTALSLLAIFALLRRVTPNAIAALALYLPFLAGGFFFTQPPSANRYGPVNLYELFPLRYAGPYLLAWLAARHIDGARPHRRWLLFLLGGFVVLNNTDFGVPAFGATIAALLWIGAPLRWSGVARLVRDALAGLLAAYVLVSIVTLLRTGSPVRLGALFLYDRIYGLAGLAELPTPALGMHIVIYLTYVAAVAAATVRTIRRDPERLLTGLLVWSGIFGLGIGGYYMGRSTPEAVVMMFSAWTLTLALLTIVTVQQLARNPKRRLTIAHFAVIFGMGVAVCSLAQTPAPWTQIKRLEARVAPIEVASPTLKQILVHYGGGRPEAIMDVIGHRMAYESGIVNVSPFIGIPSVFTLQQFDEIQCVLRSSGGHLLVLPLATTFSHFYAVAGESGFTLIGSYPEVEFETGEPRLPHGLTLWLAPATEAATHPCRTG